MWELYGTVAPLLVSEGLNWSSLYIFASCLMDILPFLFHLYYTQFEKKKNNKFVFCKLLPTVYFGRLNYSVGLGDNSILSFNKVQWVVCIVIV